jgi:molybdopterin molybdotransferase
MQSVAEAVRRILEQAVVLDAEHVTLRDSLFRTLATDLQTKDDSPRFDKAMMDGFVVRLDVEDSSAADFEAKNASPVRFPVVETITAGIASTRNLQPGEAARIMTGSVVPSGGHCVVPIEATQFDDANAEANSIVSIPRDMLRPEANILRRGAVARSGDVLLRSGCRLQPQQLAALAEFGFGSLPVNRVSSVAVLATGDELVDVSLDVPPGMIRNSNEPMLVAQAMASGARAVGLGIAKDSVESLQPLIQAGLQHDILLLSGGVSAGILDLVPSQLAKAGVQQIFHGVHMKPGKPLWFGTLDRQKQSDPANGSVPRRTYVFGLPGNPVSSLACFELFVRPLLQMLQGRPVAEPLTVNITCDFSVKGDRPVYQPARIFAHAGHLMAEPIVWSGSSDLKATVEANGMIALLPEHGRYARQSIVPAWLWGDQRL